MLRLMVAYIDNVLVIRLHAVLVAELMIMTHTVPCNYFLKYHNTKCALQNTLL